RETAVEPTARTEGHDGPAALVLHDAQRLATGEERALHVDVHGLRVQIAAHRHQVFVPRDLRAGDEYVEPAVFGTQRPEHLAYGCFVGDVGLGERRRAAVRS